MPNWVYSGFRVTGDPDEIARFRAKAFRTVPSAGAFGSLRKEGTEVILDFDAVIPMPADQKAGNYQEWAVENWGVKWNAMDLSILPTEEGSFRFQFTTAWDFPTPVFEALAAEFPGLVFEGSAYEENDAFSLAGQFNGDDDWGTVEASWSDLSEDEDN